MNNKQLIMSSAPVKDKDIKKPRYRSGNEAFPFTVGSQLLIAHRQLFIALDGAFLSSLLQLFVGVDSNFHAAVGSTTSFRRVVGDRLLRAIALRGQA